MEYNLTKNNLIFTQQAQDDMRSDTDLMIEQNKPPTENVSLDTNLVVEQGKPTTENISLDTNLVIEQGKPTTENISLDTTMMIEQGKPTTDNTDDDTKMMIDEDIQPSHNTDFDTNMVIGEGVPTVTNVGNDNNIPGQSSDPLPRATKRVISDEDDNSDQQCPQQANKKKKSNIVGGEQTNQPKAIFGPQPSKFSKAAERKFKILVKAKVGVEEARELSVKSWTEISHPDLPPTEASNASENSKNKALAKAENNKFKSLLMSNISLEEARKLCLKPWPEISHLITRELAPNPRGRRRPFVTGTNFNMKFATPQTSNQPTNTTVAGGEALSVNPLQETPSPNSHGSYATQDNLDTNLPQFVGENSYADEEMESTPCDQVHQTQKRRKLSAKARMRLNRSLKLMKKAASSNANDNLGNNSNDQSGGTSSRIPGAFSTKKGYSSYKVRIVDRSGSMNDGKMRQVHKALLKAILDIAVDGTGPKFHSFTNNSGRIEIICMNEQSYDWLEREVDKLKLWPQADLFAISETKIQKTKYVRTYFPKSEVQSVEAGLQLLKSQNTGLRTELWRVQDTTETEGGQCVCFFVDRVSAATLHSTGGIATLGFRQIHFKFRK